MMTSQGPQTRRQEIIVFSDGACTGNPGPGGWGAVLILPSEEVVELGGGDQQTTNNRMEMTAVIEGLRWARDHLKKQTVPTDSLSIVCLTDSTYLIRGITQWIWGWKKRGWTTAEGQPVNNRDLWEQLLTTIGFGAEALKIQWRYVRGHSGVAGNERCDTIAVAFSKGLQPDLYRGPLGKYGHPILPLPPETPLPELKGKNDASNKTQPLAYLSLLGRTAMRHRTWTDCERRVKGQPGAKFKKVMSREEEAALLKSWGIDPSSVRNDPS